MDDKNISNQEKKAPLGVKIVAVIASLFSLYPVISGTIELFQPDSGWFFVLYLPYLLLFYTLAFCIIFTAVMFWKGKNWARIILLIFFVIELLSRLWLGIVAFHFDYSSSFSLLKTHILSYAINIVKIVLSSLAIFYLIFNKKVKEFFKKTDSLKFQ